MFNAPIERVFEGNLNKIECHDKFGVLAISGVSNSQKALVCLFYQNVCILRITRSTATFKLTRNLRKLSDRWRVTFLIRCYRLSDFYAGNILHCKLPQGVLLQLSVSKVMPATVLTWQSEKMVMAIGWISGEVSILSGTGKDWWNLSQLHKTLVTAIRLVIRWDTTTNR